MRSSSRVSWEGVDWIQGEPTCDCERDREGEEACIFYLLFHLDVGIPHEPGPPPYQFHDPQRCMEMFMTPPAYPVRYRAAFKPALDTLQCLNRLRMASITLAALSFMCSLPFLGTTSLFFTPCLTLLTIQFWRTWECLHLVMLRASNPREESSFLVNDCEDASLLSVHDHPRSTADDAESYDFDELGALAIPRHLIRASYNLSLFWLFAFFTTSFVACVGSAILMMPDSSMPRWIVPVWVEVGLDLAQMLVMLQAKVLLQRAQTRQMEGMTVEVLTDGVNPGERSSELRESVSQKCII